MGLLFYAPPGTPADSDTWTSLGSVDDCAFDVHDEDPLTDALLDFDLNGWCAQVSFPINGFSPYGFQLLFQRRHPRVRAMHAAYGRKRKASKRR